MKAFVATSLFALVAIVSSEPPSPRHRYLPPNHRAMDTFGGYEQANHDASYQKAPSTAYGTPDVTYTVPSPQTLYGAPLEHSSTSGGYSYGRQHKHEENYGPAKYDFKYDVQDYTTGQDFGHMESRDGDKTTGRYYVLLPDGRKQIVDYVADEHGYRPTITYEKVATGHSGGYDRNAQSHGGFNGY